MNLEEIKNKMNGLSEQNSEISRQINKLKNMRVKLIYEECKKNIGRCFKYEDNNCVNYVKVIQAPKIEHSLDNVISINKYQYPSLWIHTGNELEPFEFYTLYSGNWSEDLMFKEYEFVEIDKDEFNKVFEDINNKWKSLIKSK